MTSDDTPRRQKRGPRRLSALVPAEVAPVFARRGFAGADLAVHWPEIAGPGVAKHSRALSLTWPRGGAEAGVGATLVVACSGGFALDLQQMAPVLLERINRRLGWRCVARILLKQMPVPAPGLERARPVPAPEDVKAASRIAAGIRQDALREAVTRLGAAAFSKGRRRQKPENAPPSPAGRLPERTEMA